MYCIEFVCCVFDSAQKKHERDGTGGGGRGGRSSTEWKEGWKEGVPFFFCGGTSAFNRLQMSQLSAYTIHTSATFTSLGYHVTPHAVPGPISIEK